MIEAYLSFIILLALTNSLKKPTLYSSLLPQITIWFVASKPCLIKHVLYLQAQMMDAS